MVHFAYPNVKASRFIGCGRYAVSVTDEYFEEYEKANPQPVKLSAIMESASVFAPESSVSERIIYEKKDDQEQIYIGDSLDLAYLLALIHRSVALRLNISSDIWCTGCIDLDRDCPILTSVIQAGFDVKLDAFLSEKNGDLLFIIPEANLLPQHLPLIKEKGAALSSLKEFRKSAEQNILNNKMVLKVRRNELELLTDIIFKTSRKSAKTRFFTWSAVIFAVIASCLIYIKKPDICCFLYAISPGLTENELCKVSFDSVVEDLRALGKENEAAFFNLRISPLEVRIGDTSVSYYFNSVKDCYVTIVNITTGGDIIQLFPNKLHPAQFVTAKKEYTVLDDHPVYKLRVTGPPGKEEVFAFVSESPFVLFTEDFGDQILFKVKKEDQRSLNTIAQNICKARKMNIAQREISYSIINKTD